MQTEDVSGLKCEKTFLALLITNLSEKHSIYNFYTKLICFIWKSDLVPLLSTKAQFICNAVIQKSYFLIRFLLSTYLVKSVCLLVCLACDKGDTISKVSNADKLWHTNAFIYDGQYYMQYHSGHPVKGVRPRSYSGIPNSINQFPTAAGQWHYTLQDVSCR